MSNENLRLQLELQSAGPSTPSVITDEQGNIIDRRDSSNEPIQFVFEEIHWTSEISQEEAARRVEVTFYPFKKVILYVRISWSLCYCTQCRCNTVLLPRCPTCLFQRLSIEPKQRKSWCTLFCCGEL